MGNHMNLNKIKVSEALTLKLRTLKRRTGLTPNILCRIGFCLSLKEPGSPDINNLPEDGMEFNRYTLTGQYDTLLLSLLKERCLQDGIKIDTGISNLFQSHLNRGILLLYNRVKSLVDISSLP